MRAHTGTRTVRGQLLGGVRAGAEQRQRARLSRDLPEERAGGAPYAARKWPESAGQTVAFGSSAAQTFASAGASPTIAAEFAPIAEDEKKTAATVEVSELSVALPTT